jgi:uncharacterized protein (TIGR00645 family)
MSLDNSIPPGEPHTPAERVVERIIFASRWLLAPFYIGLVFSLVVLLVKFGQKSITLVADGINAGGNEVITNVLSLIDLSLVASLVLMVMVACYENFVSRFELKNQKYKPAWMGQVDFGDLKLKLLTSIVAISAIHVLENFMNIDLTDDRELAWSLGILLGFVLAAVLLAVMNRLGAAKGKTNR